MEAKDTVIAPAELQEMYEKWYVEKEELLALGKYPEKGFGQIATDAQAEISFKAGYFEGRGLGIRDGIREVVEWIDENNTQGFPHHAWQAKLKEWGI